MTKPVRTYHTLKRLPWKQAHTYPVPWGRRHGNEGSTTVDDYDEADALNRVIIFSGISNARLPLKAQTDREPVVLTLDIRALNSRPISTILHGAAKQEIAFYDQRVGQEDWAADEYPANCPTGHPSLDA